MDCIFKLFCVTEASKIGQKGQNPGKNSQKGQTQDLHKWIKTKGSKEKYLGKNKNQVIDKKKS